MGIRVVEVLVWLGNIYLNFLVFYWCFHLIYFYFYLLHSLDYMLSVVVTVVEFISI